MDTSLEWPKKIYQKRKNATIIKEPSDELHKKQKHGRRYGRRQTSLAFKNR